MKNSKISKIATEILVELYASSEPPLDFLSFVENANASSCPDKWFDRHRISKAMHSKILSKHLKKHSRISRYDRNKIIWHVLNYSPKVEGEQNARRKHV